MAPEQQTPTSIIFLDVDGVLNSRASREASETALPDSACLDCLKRIVKATGSAIVLSSTWRFSADDERAIETALHLAVSSNNQAAALWLLEKGGCAGLESPKRFHNEFAQHVSLMGASKLMDLSISFHKNH